MKKFFVCLAMLSIFFLQSCTSEGDAEKKETLRQQTEKIGQEAVKTIKTPLEQARMAAEQETSHGKTVEKEVGRQ
jgi:PBP1b-binding outer membrane lipoprotein LpoB